MASMIDEARAALLDAATHGGSAVPVVAAYLRSGKVTFGEWEQIVHDVHRVLQPETRNPKLETPLGKPGTKLHTKLASIGLKITQGCGCEIEIARMNRWGPEGCERHRNRIIGGLLDAYEHSGWQETLVAAGLLVRRGLLRRLTPWRVLASLVDESIEEARIEAAVD